MYGDSWTAIMPRIIPFYSPVKAVNGDGVEARLANKAWTLNIPDGLLFTTPVGTIN